MVASARACYLYKNWQKLLDIAIIAQPLPVAPRPVCGNKLEHSLARDTAFFFEEGVFEPMSPLAPFDLLRALRTLQGFITPWPRQSLAPGWGRLGFLLLASVLFSFWVAAPHVEAEMLFQSPESPPPPIIEQAPPESSIEQPPAEQPPAEQPPLEQPPAEQPPVEQPPVEQAPVQQPPVEQAPVEQPPLEQALPESAPPAVEPGAPAAPAAPTTEPVRRRNDEAPVVEEESNGPANFILDQAELIDTVVVSGAYIWLCCGVSLFLLVPLALLFVYIRGRSKIIREEGY